MTSNPNSQIPDGGSQGPITGVTTVPAVAATADSISAGPAKAKKRLPMQQPSLSQMLLARKRLSEKLAAAAAAMATRPTRVSSSPPPPSLDQRATSLPPPSTHASASPESRCGTQFVQFLRAPSPAVQLQPHDGAPPSDMIVPPPEAVRTSSQATGSPATPISALVDMLEESASTLIDYLELVGGLAAADVGEEDFQKLATTFAVLTQVAHLADSGIGTSPPVDCVVDPAGTRKRKRSLDEEAQEGDMDPSVTTVMRSLHKGAAQTSTHYAPSKSAEPSIPHPKHSHHQITPTLRSLTADPSDLTPAPAHGQTLIPPSSSYTSWTGRAPPAGAVYMSADPTFHLPAPSDALATPATATSMSPVNDQFSAWTAALRTIEPARRLSLTEAIEASRVAVAQAASEGATSASDVGDAASTLAGPHVPTADQHEAAPAAVAPPAAPRPIQQTPCPPAAAAIPAFAHPYAAAALANGYIPAFPPLSALPPHPAPPSYSALHHVYESTLPSFSKTLARAQAVMPPTAPHKDDGSKALPAFPLKSSTATTASLIGGTLLATIKPCGTKRASTSSTISVAHGWTQAESNLLASLIAQHGRAYKLFVQWHGPNGTQSRALAKFDSTKHLVKRWQYLRDQRAMQGLPPLPEGVKQGAGSGKDVKRAVKATGEQGDKVETGDMSCGAAGEVNPRQGIQDDIVP